ncbi:type II secretion system F family protein [Levilactobacillus senmaizukei]|uniref:type II secretion system F family protein n=1 Tax=Levilactobacillus senmaizukei TaxID=431273 RepID=UPI001F488C64|nr:type II secretion system F family protein [Levilactobacillus senmaizukei]
MAKFRRQRHATIGMAKWSLTQQAFFCHLLGEQLQSGFSLQAALQFMQLTNERSLPGLEQIEQSLLTGTSLMVGLKPYLRPNIYFQLTLATTYGNFSEALIQAAAVLTMVASQRQRLRQLLAYPVTLLVLMAGLFLTLQLGILPQLRLGMTGGITRSSANWYPWVGAIGGSGVALLLFLQYWRSLSSLRRVEWLIRWPVIGSLVKSYYAYYLTANVGQLVASGLSIKQMVHSLQQLPSQAVLCQLATQLEDELNRGQSPTAWIKRQNCLPRQLLVFLTKGSSTSQLERELMTFSRLEYQRLTRQSERALAVVQPVLLSVVALLIVMAYLRLLLPMYQNLQEGYHG